MVDAMHGYAPSGADTDRYKLLHTNDGGHIWSDVTPSGVTVHPSGRLTIVGPTRVRVRQRPVRRARTRRREG